MHHGGELIIGPDEFFYLVVGDLARWKYEVGKTKAQNYNDARSLIEEQGCFITQEGKQAKNRIFGDTFSLNLHYAYGIPNSFGIDFDPLTGKQWDMEIGPDYGDEINFVVPGFNSGTDIVRGGMTTSFGKVRKIRVTFFSLEVSLL
jgi:aldose sugar dehydrogenase